MVAKENTFEKLLLEAIDEALSSLGNSARQAIYFHLEDKFKIRRDEIPDRLEDFTDGIEKIFGLGAKFLQILIMKNLYEKIGISLEWDECKDLMFVEYIRAAEESFRKSKRC
ncbi:MAG: hypothetical protein QXZ25_00300 [Candidatus Bathyarchaeia archaeon]